MGVTIELTEETARHLTRRAAGHGMTLQDYVEALLKPDPAAGKSFAEIAKPVSDAFARTGCTEEELDALVEQARQEIWDERQSRLTTQ